MHSTADPYYLSGMAARFRMAVRACGIDVFIDDTLRVPAVIHRPTRTIYVQPGLADLDYHAALTHAVRAIEFPGVGRHAAPSVVVPFPTVRRPW